MPKLKIMTKDDTNFMRAIAIVGIILHHIYNASSTAILLPFKYMGFLLVGVFFLLSGYGLFTSLKNKGDYIKKIPRKILELLISYAIAFIIYYLVHEFIGIEENNVFNVVRNSWYLYQLIIYYILFYFSFKFFDKRRGKVIFSLLAISVLVVEYFLGFSELWYKSSLTFIIGIVLADNLPLFEKYRINKKIFICQIIFLIVLLIIGMKTKIGIFDIILYNVATILFATLFIQLFYYFRLYKINNKFFEKIGSMSLELYLYHGLVIEILTKFIDDKYVNIILILIISYIIANIINIINKKINSILKIK